MILLDSSFLISVEVETDQNHGKTIKIMEDIIDGKYGVPVISDYVFDEIVTVTFGKTKDLKKTTLVGQRLLDATKIFKIEDINFKEAWEIFKSQKDTKFSFTDCTTMSLLRQERIRYIATFDKDFRKVKEITVRP